ncbi:MAG TPA: hypothetical protein VFS43_06460 [Polyangiaceae bacterium]|nr:hypothetical protein [Polyangiaceae bacterium]
MKLGITEGRLPTPTPQTPAGPPGPPSPPPARSPDEGPSAFSRVLNGLAANLERGEAVAERAAKGGQVASDPASLIALQADMYRYVEAVDLASKLVDRATGAVKTVLQSQ